MLEANRAPRHVSGLHPPTMPLPRPRQVTLAVALFAGSLLIGAGRALLLPIPGPVLIGVLTLLLCAGVAASAYAGQNWARILLVAFFVLGLPFVFMIREVLTAQGSVAAAVLVLQTVMQGAAAVLLFTPPSNAWFKAPRGPAA